MNMQRFGNWLVAWVVEEDDENGNPNDIRWYCNAKKAAEFVIMRGKGTVRMKLIKPEWDIKTQD